MPSPLTPIDVERKIKDLFRGFFEQGFKKKTDVPLYLKSLPNWKLGGYGGNTPCVEVSAAKTQIIVDGGSGIRNLGIEMMNGPCAEGKGEVHIFFTHFHWDHLIGLPFFTPLFVPGNQIHVYAVQPELESVFQTVFRKPYFPLQLKDLGATIHYHRLEPRKPFKMKDIQVTPYQLDHPDPCWGYKFEYGGKTYSHCVDTECTRISRAQLGEDLPLYQNVDLLVFDAQYTLLETLEKVHWGHAAASLGLDIAMREGIKQVIFMHHDPSSNDKKISTAEAQARKYYDTQISMAKKAQQRKKTETSEVRELKWSFGYDGLEIEI